MKKVFLLTSAFLSTTALAAPNPSFSEIRLGFETIEYQETLGNLAGITNLKQDASVTNPTIRQLSYTGIDDNWGFYIDSAATVATEIDTEVWSTSDFGAIQQNDFKTKANEIGFTAAYNFTKALQFTFGAQIKTTSFTRSNFKIVKPGADAFDKALIDLEARFNLPGQTKDLDDPLINNPQELSLVVSVTEDQMNLNAALGVRYDSRLADAFNDLSWYAEAKINTPLYSRTQSTSIEELTLTDSFNGWGVMARAGIRYQLKEHIAVMIGVDADKHERDKIAFEQVDGRRRAVPDISYSNVSVSAGLQWSY